MPLLNPNRRPFPRRSFIEPALDAGLKERIHPLRRSELEPDFRERDPQSWPHGLGAADVFLDNFGMLMGEQFQSIEEESDYFRAVQDCMRTYEFATKLVRKDSPWTGRFLLGKARRANAGEPRPILRLLTEHDLTMEEAVAFWEPKATNVAWDHMLVEDMPPEPLRPRYENIPWRMLLPDGWTPGPAPIPAPAPSTGLLLPDGFPLTVPPPRLLHPRECTPDLPLRVGMETKDRTAYARLVRDQGTHGTCVAHAVTTGLAVAAHRAGIGRRISGGFSPAWVHYASAREGQSWGDGRTLAQGIDAVRELLPCRESSFHYASAPLEGATWRSPARESESGSLTGALGLPMIQKVAPADISKMKALLAAGWVIVAGTYFPERWKGQALRRYGLPLTPLGGDRREPYGHAWLLVGYDHVDGNQQWKYQGRFWCLNSWGSNEPAAKIWGPGICSLPFSCFLTEGIEAYALKFPNA